MRVIAGRARRIQLTSPQGLQTRPTTDRIKETLFNIIQEYLADARFLDLFSGSGAIGIEAVSRGAKEAVLVENNKAALDAIAENIEKTNFEDECKVMSMDCMGAMKVLSARCEPFDVIFMDPPYDQNYEKDILQYLSASNLLNEEALVIFETSLEAETDYAAAMGYEIYKIKEYKTNKHVFLIWKGTI